MPPLVRGNFDIDDNYRRNENNGSFLQEGGFFLSYIKTSIAAMVFIACLMAVGLLTYFLSPGYQYISKTEKAIEEAIDLALIDLDSHHSPEEEMHYRLASKVVPQHYRIKIHPILDEDPVNNYTFTGEVKIIVLANDSDIKEIVFHALKLDIKQAAVKVEMHIRQSAPLTSFSHTNENDTENTLDETTESVNISRRDAADNLSDLLYASSTSVKIVKQTYSEKYQKHTLHLESPLQKGRNYTIYIPYSGDLWSTFDGFYYVPSQSWNNNSKMFAVTQFEPTFARSAFPCFDEPKFRTTFDISIGRRIDLISLSNTQIKATEPMEDNPNYVWDHYETTPRMSTYLVAFVVGDFASRAAFTESKYDVELKIWTDRRQLPENITYIEYIIAPIFDFFMDTFDAEYPFKKLDFLLIPMSTGGMENWGLITITEDLMLVNDSKTTQKQLEPIFSLVAHEIAHQWFGNLVSIGWWDDMWLKEGLVSFLENLISNRFHPEWKSLESFLVNNVNYILSNEVVGARHPVSVKLVTPTEINQRFDEVVYQKGACLFRMLNATLTESVFLNGIRRYLQKRKYKTGTLADLWEGFTTAAKEANRNTFDGIDVKTFMDNWVHKPGVPLVTVRRNYTSGVATVSQQRFLLSNETDDTLWYIPLNYVTDGKFHKENRLIMENKRSIQIYNDDFKGKYNQTKWVLFNPYLSGLYRVHYDFENLKLVRNAILRNPREFPLSAKYQFMDDSFSMAQVGLLRYSVALDVSTAILYDIEDDYSSWHIWYDNIEFIDRLFAYRETYGLFQEYVLRMVGPRYSKFRLNKANKNNSVENKHLENFITKLACLYEYKECVNWALKEFDKIISMPIVDNQTNPIDPSIRDNVYITAVSHGGKLEWDILYARVLVTHNDPYDFNEIIQSLAYTRSKWMIRRYLTLLFVERMIPMNSIVTIVRLFKSRIAVDALFDFLVQDFQAVIDSVEGNLFTLATLLKIVLWQLSTQEQLDKLLTLFKNNKDVLHPYAMTLKEAIERTKYAIFWSKTYAPQIDKWLRAFSRRRY